MTRYRRVLCCVLTCIWLSLDGNSAQVCSDINLFTNINQDRSITGSVFRKLTGYGLVGCAKQCLLRSACQSFNYELSTATCQLNRNSSTTTVQPGGEVVTAVGTVSSDKSTWPTRVAGICGGKTCPYNSVCVEQSDGSTSCKFECPDPVLSNGNIVGVISHNVGTTLTFQCNSGYQATGEAKCLSNGLWEQFGCQGCDNAPTITNGVLTSTGTTWVVGTVLNYTCHGSYIAMGKVECLSTLNWTTMKCIPKIPTCADLLRCNRAYTDGEYWLCPDVFVNKPVKIYCHNMASGTPTHFLTLPEENYVDYSDTTCDPDTGLRQLYAGCESTRFNKLRISDVTTMTTNNIGLKDYSFTNTSSQCYYIQYGNINDCHASCNTAKTRNYVINTRGTGLKVASTQVWQVQDSSTTFTPITVVKEDLERKITIKCHQPCKWCYPVSDTYTFVLDTYLAPGMDDAVPPACSPLK